MRKRKRPDGNPLDPKTYEPNPQRLWDCVQMASGLAFPSLRFLATLAWHRAHPDDLISLRSGDLTPPVATPPQLPTDLWNELAWVLGNRRDLLVPSGARIQVGMGRPGGNCACYLRWCVRFPEDTMGGAICSANWRLEMLKGVGLVRTNYRVRMRTHELSFRNRMRFAYGEPGPALTKRGRWYAPRPRQVDPGDKPPELAQRALTMLWERKISKVSYASINELTHSVIWGDDAYIGGESERFSEHREKLFDAVVWLYLDGQVDLAAHREWSSGTCAKYRLKRHPKRRVGALATWLGSSFPQQTIAKIRSVLHDDDTVVALQAEKLRSGAMSGTAIGKIFLQRRLHPLVWDALVGAGIV